ncbi:UDP-2,4-diacetamido-2,4,6-trideoxy-beta-L-altropyranose hydrolase [Clostridium sp. ZS2-4]|uniref:UDP-2,4-diacetamido-2,4, 6-trideoxy-beta-L-altropyranose hydrolase n=1 Tax=Clostridium sp. ZS2-4 TaxID=2987703 RepID=UPI00227CF120|nr:UDP-2,4-diacetamido-2,4,6-trideoxy-beta-L-altropyranose hydrolase [Clostridium sp. ZS2-4]MCY6353995.1 UDP-2,4-diacetamido-2,4,6-trideoxy-beta-L-altropyranose hydrolase [Clostridium sp. ZS2-4]
MKIAIRADGGSKIGMGHIMRTLVLVEELAKTNEVFYVCKVNNSVQDKYKAGIDKVKNAGFNVKLINENNVIEELKNIKADMLITDSYDVNEVYFNETKKIFEITGYIDDIKCLDYYNVDFIINQNIGAEEWYYKVNEDTKLFLGSQYTMLREEFRNSPNKIIKEEVSDVMITIGGADPNDITNKVLNYVKDIKLNFHVVVGPSFDEEQIKELKKMEKSNVRLYFNVNMVEIMNKCDIAISACGSTIYELAACGVPTLGIIIADNQEKAACKMEEKGLIYNLGWCTSLTRDSIIYNLTKLYPLKIREQMISNQRIINKNGVLELNNLKIKEKLNTIDNKYR